MVEIRLKSRTVVQFRGAVFYLSVPQILVRNPQTERAAVPPINVGGSGEKGGSEINKLRKPHRGSIRGAVFHVRGRAPASFQKVVAATA